MSGLLGVLAGSGGEQWTPPPDPLDPPPGTPSESSLLPPAPSADAEQLRFSGGKAPFVERVTPATPWSQIMEWESRSAFLRNGWGSSHLDYRLTLVMEPGTYQWARDAHMGRGWSLISATGSGDPSDVVLLDIPGQWGTVEGSGPQYYEGIEIVCSADSKYPIHQYGGRLHVAHCHLSVTAGGWGSGAAFGHDGYPGDVNQFHATKFSNPVSSGIANTHATTSGDDARIVYRLKDCDFSDAQTPNWGFVNSNRTELLWVENSPGVTWSPQLDLQSSPLVWDQV